MKTRNLALVGLLVMSAWLSRGACGREGNTESRPDVAEFGVSEERVVEKGYLFSDGRYIESPYHIRREGLALTVNGVVVRKPAQWPQSHPNPAEEKGPGPLPKGLTRDMTFKDFDAKFEWHALAQCRHLQRTLGVENSVVHMAEYYRSLPFVEKVKVEDNVILLVETWRGERRQIDVGPPPTSPPVNGQELLAEVEASRQSLEERLATGWCVFTTSRGGQLGLDSRRIGQILPEMIQILGSDAAASAKLARLDRLGIRTSDNPDLWDIMVKEFKSSPQIDARIKAIQAQGGTRVTH